jgi:hypothetical protein
MYEHYITGRSPPPLSPILVLAKPVWWNYQHVRCKNSVRILYTALKLFVMGVENYTTFSGLSSYLIGR